MAQRKTTGAPVGHIHRRPTSRAKPTPNDSRRKGTQSHQADRPRPRVAPDLDIAAVRTCAELEAIQQPHGDVQAAIRGARRLFKVWLDCEART
jgi:hypothetical protein